jgi:pimeloyl-ACP methyl ester carboxylesterase
MDEVLIKGWRRVAYRRCGDPDGYPVFLLHGTPGSRISARPTDAELCALGVCLITYDRPGYGLSDPQPGRTVADAADDVRAIANACDYGRFAVLGRSGGGPHALACAALLSDRVSAAASLVGLAPYGAVGLDWLKGMAKENQIQYAAAVVGPAALARILYPQAVAMRDDPEHFVRRIESDAVPADRMVLADPQYRKALIAAMTEGIGRSLDGWTCDSLAFTRPWGFEPHLIAVPTLLWHGAWDVFSPVSHARWLAERIKTAILVLSESAHLSAAGMQFGAIKWLLNEALGGPVQADAASG